MSNRADFLDDNEDLDLDDKDVLVEEDKEADTKTKDGKDDELEVELTKDPLYEKPTWKDADKVADEDDDKDRGRDAKKRINKLRAANTELARQRDQREAELTQAVDAYKSLYAKASELEKRVVAGNSEGLESAAVAQETAASLAEKKYRDALVAGDSDAAAKANSDLAEAKARAVRLREKLSESKVAESVKQEPQQRQQQAIPAMPATRLAWFKANPWFDAEGGDDLSEHAIKAHRALVAKGVQIDTDEYFDAINRSVRAKFPEKFGIRRQEATASARTSESSSRIQGNKIKLSPAEYATAQRLGLTSKVQLVAYAKEIMSREKEGK